MLTDAQYLITPILGWVVAQAIKFGLTLHKDGVSILDAFQSGGMPSSHAAFMMSLTTLIGLNEGFTSPIFALSLAISGIVMYDARSVRLATGQQTEVIRKLAKKQNLKINITNAKGHRVIEIIAGAAIGVSVGLLTHLVL